VRELQSDPPDPLAILEQAQKIFGPQVAPNDDFARFERFLSVADRLAGWRGGAGARSGWDVALDFRRELGQPILNLLNNIMVIRSQGHAAAAPGMPAASPVAPSAFGPCANQAAMWEHARRMNGQPAEAPQQPNSAPQSAAPFPVGTDQAPPAAAAQDAAAPGELLALLRNYGGLIINAMNSGVSGFEFADSLEHLLGTGAIVGMANFGDNALTPRQRSGASSRAPLVTCISRSTSRAVRCLRSFPQAHLITG
jgi:hypothetical protein